MRGTCPRETTMATRTQSIMIWKNANLSLAFTKHCDNFVAKLEVELGMDANDFLTWCELKRPCDFAIFSDLEEAMAAGLAWLESNAGKATDEIGEREVESFMETLKYELKGMVLHRLRAKAA